MATINGNIFANTLTGTGDPDLINGNGGADSIDGAGGADTLNGGNGNDSITGGIGGDVANGDDGNDNIVGGLGNDLIHGNNDDDTMDGGGGNDTLYGDEGHDSINGGADHDNISGGDHIIAYVEYEPDLFRWEVLSNGTDTINGGSGNDTIRGGQGNDQLTGGTGADRFEIYAESFDGAHASAWDPETSSWINYDADYIFDFSYANGDRVAVDYADFRYTQYNYDYNQDTVDDSLYVIIEADSNADETYDTSTIVFLIGTTGTLAGDWLESV